MKAIAVENVSKSYRLGSIGGATLKQDLARWWAKARRRPDPTAPIGQEHHARRMGETFWALQDVTFQVGQGEVWGIVGRNGAGKSTLLKILSQVTAPTSGAVKIKGRIASLLEVGTGFHPELSGRENVYLNGAILGMQKSEIRRKFDEIVDFSGISEFIDTPVKRYSSGMYVRLAFAVAAHLDPEILVIDEVLAVGDVAFQKKCVGKMESASRKEGRTVLFVSHNLHAIRQLCQSVVVLDAGEVVAMGDTRSMIARYAQIFGNGKGVRVPPPPPELLNRGYLTDVRVETTEGKTLTVYPVGTPWRLRVSFRICRPMDDFVVAIGLMLLDGTAVQTAWAPPRRMERGDYEAIFSQVNVILAAGDYNIVVGLNERDQTFQQPEVARISITGEGAIGYYPVTSGTGIVLNSTDIVVRSL